MWCVCVVFEGWRAQRAQLHELRLWAQAGRKLGASAGAPASSGLQTAVSELEVLPADDEAAPAALLQHIEQELSAK